MYRALNPLWARQPLSGDGARRYGGRFNGRGVAALYTSLDVLTAIAESNQAGKPVQPTTLVSITADVEAVFDARDTAALASFGMTQQALAADDWRLAMRSHGIAPTQALAATLRQAGYNGLLTPSFARDASPGGTNLVFWTWGTQPPSRLSVNDSEGRLTS